MAPEPEPLDEARPLLCEGDSADLRVRIDHGQFILCDLDSELDVDAYHEKAQAVGFAAWRGGLSVFTESLWTESTVRVQLLGERPILDLGPLDHVAEGGIICATGELRAYGPEDTGISEAVVRLPPGSYSVIVAGEGFATTDEFGDNGDDRYTVFLWPGDALGPRVLKDGRPGRPK